MILDPWDLSQDFLLKFNEETIIKSPCKVFNFNKNNKTTPLIIKRYDIIFNIINKNNSSINISTIQRGLSGYKLVELIIKSDKIIKVGHIENISKNNYYSGSDLMIFALQILYRLNIKECTLKDVFSEEIISSENNSLSTLKHSDKFIISYYNCIRNSFFKQNEIPMKIIRLFKNNNTFYSIFNFQPFDKLTKINKMDEIRNLVGILCQISWKELDDIIVSGKNQIIEMNPHNIKMNYNMLEIRNINKWKQYWNSIHNSWIIFKTKFNNSRTPFSAFKFFDDKNNCSDFIDWLELYSFTFLILIKLYYINF